MSADRDVYLHHHIGLNMEPRGGRRGGYLVVRTMQWQDMVAAACTWGHLLQGQHITVPCDHMAVVQAWSNQWARHTTPHGDTAHCHSTAQFCHLAGPLGRQTQPHCRHSLPQPVVTVLCPCPTGQPQYLLPSTSSPVPPPQYLLPSTSFPVPPPQYLIPSTSFPIPPPHYLLFDRCSQNTYWVSKQVKVMMSYYCTD